MLHIERAAEPAPDSAQREALLTTPANQAGKPSPPERLTRSDVSGASMIGQVYRALRADPEMRPFVSKMKMAGPVKVPVAGEGDSEPAMVITLNVGQRTNDAFAIRKKGGVFQVLANISGSKALGEFGRRSVAQATATRAAAKQYGTDPGKTKTRALYNQPGLAIPDVGNFNQSSRFVAMPATARSVKDLVSLIGGEMKKSLTLEAEPVAGKVPVPESAGVTLPAKTAVPKIRREIEALLKKWDIGTDVKIYSQKEWKDRGEPYGNDSPLSMTFEGALYDVLNDPNKSTMQIHDEFYAIPQKYGWYWELGYAWSAHLYPAHQLKERAMSEAAVGKRKKNTGIAATIIRQVRLDPAIYPFRLYLTLGSTEVSHGGKTIPAALLSVDKEGTRLGDFAVFRSSTAGDVKETMPYKVIANIGGSRAVAAFGRKNVGRQKATMSAAQEFGTDPSKTKTKVQYSNKDNAGDMQGAAQEKGRFLTIPSAAQTPEDMKKLLVGMVLKVLGEPTDVTVPEATTVYGVHSSGKFLCEDTDMEQEPGLAVPFDYYGDGEGLYVAADTLYQGDYKGTLAEAVAAPEKLEQANWSNTIVEVIGPIPDGITKLASPKHWKLVAATQAFCREEAMEKFVETIGKSGCTAEAKYGTIHVCNEGPALAAAGKTLRGIDKQAKASWLAKQEKCPKCNKPTAWGGATGCSCPTKAGVTEAADGRSYTAERLKKKYGGVWAKHPEFTVEDWKYEVANDDTRQGYWDWVSDKIAGVEEEKKESVNEANLTPEAWTAAVDKIMKKKYGLDHNDWFDENFVDATQDPDEFADWYADKYGLSDVRDTGFGIREAKKGKKTVEDDEPEPGDDMCDICMQSGVAVYQTTKDGKAMCTKCAEEYDEDEDTNEALESGSKAAENMARGLALMMRFRWSDKNKGEAADTVEDGDEKLMDKAESAYEQLEKEGSPLAKQLDRIYRKYDAADAGDTYDDVNDLSDACDKIAPRVLKAVSKNEALFGAVGALKTGHPQGKATSQKAMLPAIEKAVKSGVAPRPWEKAADKKPAGKKNESRQGPPAFDKDIADLV